MSKRTKKLPFWQHTPCPAWCIGGHGDTDGPVERFHLSRWDRRVTLELHSPDVVRHDGETVCEPAELSVVLRQPYRESEPTVNVAPEMIRADLPDLDLTLVEARKLGRALLRAVEIAEDGAR
jgi:hypothetical protein